MKQFAFWMALFLVVALDVARVRMKRRKAAFKICSDSKSCPHQYCCTGTRASPKGVGICKRNLHSGQICKRILPPGDKTCPCMTGLTCILDVHDRKGKAINRCVPVFQLIFDFEGLKKRRTSR